MTIAVMRAGCAFRAARGILSHARAPLPTWGSIPMRALCASTLPDYKAVTMPALSPTMAVGTILEWKKAEGDPIEAGEVIAEIETDKATRSFEYNDDGYMARVFYDDGAADVSVGKLICIIVEEEEDIAAFKEYTPPDDAPAPAASEPEPKPAATGPPASAPASTPAPPVAAPQSVAPAGSRVLASPLARVTAASAGVGLAAVAGTGPGGRVIAADVTDALAAGLQPIAHAPASAPQTVPGLPMYTDVEASSFKRATAEHLLHSKQTVPHYYLTVDCDIGTTMSLRTAINDKAKDGAYKLSVNDFVVKAAAAALRKVPEVNAQWMGDSIRMFHSADISVAVQTERGLITPIIKDADRKGLKEISSDIKALAAKAKDKGLEPEEFVGGTFTVSNLGMYGVNNFSAIVNTPQAAILAVGASEQRVVPDSSTESGFSTKTFLGVTLSCDHRVVDGAVGAQWLSAFKSCIEDPIEIVL